MNLPPIDDADKGRFTAQELVQSRADRIDVVQWSRRFAIPLLRTYVRRTACRPDLPRQHDHGVADGAGDTEVCNFQVPMAVQHEISWF
jgi:hypothetical protein